MKIFKRLIVFISIVSAFVACQKQIDFDANGLSTGTLKKDGTGNCKPSTINGIYQKDTALTADNFIDVNVDVTTVGTYTIKSDTVNGFSFKGTGTLGVVGNNVVRLYGSGKPLASGISTFTVQYGTSICIIDVTVIGPGGGAAIYTLGGAPGACSGFTLGSGSYVAGQILVAANTVLTNVNVTQAGTYDLGTDTVNGIYFRSAGVFTTAGVQSITLVGTGTPIAAGTFNYKLNNGSTTCTFSITVTSSGGGGSAVYTLGGSPSNCTGVTLAGTYQQGVTLSGNTVKVDVTVTAIGTYSITVAGVNGVSFSATGSFTTTGPQQLTLQGTGTPTASGPFNYIISGPGGTTCTFTVTYTSAPPGGGNLDYIPQTTGSNWSTKLVGGGPGDTTYMEIITNNITLGGQSYRIFQYKQDGIPTDSVFIRKNGGQYYNFLDQDFGIVDAPFNKEILLLDSTLSVGATWVSNLGSNTVGGVPLTVKINNEIIAKGAVETVSGITYVNIIKVKSTYIANLGLGDTPIGDEERWYAKGFGPIHDLINISIPTPSSQVSEATRIQIY